MSLLCPLCRDLYNNGRRFSSGDDPFLSAGWGFPLITVGVFT